MSRKLKNNSLCYLVYGMLLIALILQILFYPNFILSEEHHYLEVATNMFYHHQWWLLEDSRGIYLSKPPCLFWMLSGLWFLFGAHVWVVHFFLLTILAGVLGLAQCLYRLLFGDVIHARLVPVIVLGSFFFFSRGLVFCFDILVVLFFLISAIGIALALKHYYFRGFVLFGLGVGLGILTKGPIILGFCLPFFIVATFYRKHYQVNDRTWFFCFIFSEIIILLLLALWLLPLINILKFSQWYALLLQRGAGVGKTYGSAEGYFYIKVLFLLLLPWILWPYGLKVFARTCLYGLKDKKHSAFKIVFYSLLLSLVFFSLIPPKQMRYVMSVVVLFSMLYTYALCQNKLEFCVKNDSTRGVLIFLVGIVFVIEMVTLFFPKYVMSHVHYPSITWGWVLFFESFIFVAGGVLIVLKKRGVVFEALRLCGFVFVLILNVEILPHEVLSSHFPYRAFVEYLYNLEKQSVPIIYCRAYGGYQYGITGLSLPEEKYKLSVAESELYVDVYLVKKIDYVWKKEKAYFYRLIDPSQDSAIFVEKIKAKKMIKLMPKQQRCEWYVRG